MTTTGGIDDGVAADGAGEPAARGMCFTVMDRRADRVHLVSVEAGTGTLYGHPPVCEEVWQAALDEVPPNWEVVDLCPTPADDPEPGDLDDFARRKYDLFLAFLGAGFERCEALTLVIETLHPSGD